MVMLLASALGFNVNAQVSKGQDVLVNGSFDTANQGWTTVNMGYQQNGERPTRYLEKWQGGGIQQSGSATQTVASLPAGIYTFKGFANTRVDETTVTISVNEKKVNVSGFWKEYSITYVQDATQDITVKFEFVAPLTSDWVAIDGFSLVYEGSFEDYKKAAEALYDSPMNATVLAELKEAANVSDVQGDALLEAINTLSEKIVAANNSIAIYATTKASLEAYAAKVATLDAAGKAAYNVADIEAAYNNGSMVEDQTAAIVAAYAVAVKAQNTAGADFTGAIVNPEINGADGWTIERPLGGNGPLLNNVSFEYWAGNSSDRAKASFDYYQVITGLPAGKYTVSAEMYNSLNGEGGSYTEFSPTSGVYAESGNNEVSKLVDVDSDVLKAYTTEAIVVMDGTLRIGVKNVTTPMAARWFVADNFKLTLVEPFLNVDGIIYATGDNLFVNGSFDNGVEGWKTIGYTTDAVASNFVLSETGGFDGGAYITTNGGGVASEKTIRQSVEVETGKMYYFAVYTSGKAPDAANFKYNALFKMTDATTEVDPGVIKEFEWPQGAGKTSAEWSKTEYIFTAETPFVGARMGWNASSNFDGFVLCELEMLTSELDAAKIKALKALEALVPVGDGIFQYPSDAVAAAKAAIEAAETVEAVEAVKMPTMKTPQKGRPYAIVNATAEGNLCIGEGKVTVNADAVVYFTAVEGGYAISNAEGEYIFKTSADNWTLATTTNLAEAYVLNVNGVEGGYTITGSKGTLGLDNAEAGSTVYANKAIGNNGLWSTIEAMPQFAAVKMTYVDYDKADEAIGEVEVSQAGYNKIANGEVGFVNTSWGCNWITYISVDASAIAGDNVTSAKLTAEVSGSTDSKRNTIWGVGYNASEWSADMTYNTADKTITTLGDTYTTTTKDGATFETVTFDITKAFAEGKVATILVYETAAAGGYIKNVKVEVETLDDPVEAAKVKALDALAMIPVGEGLFLCPQATIDAVKAAIEAATTVEEVEAIEMPAVTLPAEGQAYAFSLTTSEGTFYLNTENGVKIEEEATPIYLVPQDGGTYALYNGEEYVNYAGGDTWTTGTTEAAYGWTVAALAEGQYTITGKNGFLGTNTSDGNGVGSSCYGDKKTSNGNYIWNITETEAQAPKVYTIEIAETANGTVTADVAEAEAGATVTLTVTPAEGYVLDELTVTYGEDNAEVEVAEDYTFTMPKGNVTVTATFVDIPVLANVAAIAGIYDGNAEKETAHPAAGVMGKGDEDMMVTISVPETDEVGKANVTFSDFTILPQGTQTGDITIANVEVVVNKAGVYTLSAEGVAVSIVNGMMTTNYTASVTGTVDAEGNADIVLTLQQALTVTVHFTGKFDKDLTTGINNVNTDAVKANGKYLENGKVVIYRNGIKYGVNGAVIK